MIEIIDDIPATETMDEPVSATCECHCACKESRLDGETGPVGADSATMASTTRLATDFDINN